MAKDHTVNIIMIETASYRSNINI